MAINFPNNPNPNDTHSSGGKTWIWDGTTWKLNNTTASGISLTDFSVTTNAVGTAALSYDNAGVFSYTPPNLSGYSVTTHNHSFISITGTPSSYDDGKWLRSTATGVEWVTAPTGNDTNDYLNTGSLVANTLVLTRTGSQSLSDVTVDLSSLNSVPTTITVADESQDTECYPLFSKDPTGDIDPKTGTNIKFNSVSGQLEAGSFKKTGGSAAEFLKADGSIDSTTYLSSVALNDLSNVDAVTNVAQGKILKYNGSSWEVGDDNTSGGGGGATTINNNADNRIITGSATANTLNAESSLTYDGNSLFFSDDKAIKFGSNLRMQMYTDGSINYIKSSTDGSGAFPISIHSGSEEVINIDDGHTQIKTGIKDKDGDLGTAGQVLSSTGAQINWIDAPVDTNTTYDLTTDAVTDGGIIRLTASDSTTDDVQVLGGTSITVSRSADHKLTISSDITDLNSLSDVTISGSVPNDYILQYDTTDSKWKPESVPVGVSIANNGNNRIVTGVTGNELHAEGNLTFDSNTNILAVTGSATISNDLTITGNLTVNGTQTIINTATLEVEDGDILLNKNQTGSPTLNGGIEIERGSSTNVRIRWNETTDKWQYTNDGTTFSDIGSSTTDTDTTYSISCVDGANSDEERIRLTAGGSGSGTDDIVLEAGTGLSIARSGDKITFANTASNTTYDLRTESVSGGGIIRLENEITNTTDDVQILGGTSITVSRSADHKLTIASDITNLNSLSDVTISGSVPNGYYLKYDTNDSQWKPDDPSNLGGTDTNYYASSLSWNTSNGILTVNRSGLSALTVDLDGRYATGTIPTNNNQLTNGAGYITSSGTITNSEKSRIRTDTGNTYHNLVFVDSYSDNQFQVLKVDNASDSLAYNPSANRLIAQDLESFRMTSWGHDYGDSGQFLMSKGSSAWEWSQYVYQSSGGELRLKRTDTSLEGGHLQFEDSDGNNSFAIDVYGTTQSNSVLRFIDQNTGTERFSINRSGAWGIGHVGSRSFGSSGNVLISQGSGSQPIWGSLSQALSLSLDASTFATSTQGTKADANDADIDDIYTQLNAIGNDDTITTVAQLKTALLALVRS